MDCVWSAADVIAFVGILLGFISVLLSAIAIWETCTVRKEVDRHQFRMRQLEEMSNLVKQLNSFVFYMDHRKEGQSYLHPRSRHCVNLKGMIELYVSNRMKEYRGNRVYYSESFCFLPAQDYSSSPYIPIDVAKNLSFFLPGVPKIDVTVGELGNDFEIITWTKEKPNPKYITQQFGPYTTWESFVRCSEQLIKSIEDWYTQKNRYNLPNIMAYQNEVDFYVEKSKMR